MIAIITFLVVVVPMSLIGPLVLPMAGAYWFNVIGVFISTVIMRLLLVLIVWASSHAKRIIINHLH